MSSSSGHGDDHRHSHASSSKSKLSKSSLGKDIKDKKINKLTPVLPSKDKLQHSQQSYSHGPISSQSTSSITQTATSSSISNSSAHHSTQISHTDKSTSNSTSYSQPIQNEFTDLFGTPIRPRPSPDPIHSKIKVSSQF